MKVVLDTMLWVSYCTRRDGVRALSGIRERHRTK